MTEPAFMLVGGTIEGPLGPATVDDVDATYDLRPPAGMIVVYLIPFVGIGFLWVKLLLKRRRPEREARPAAQVSSGVLRLNQ